MNKVMEGINNIKNCLLHLESFDDVDTFSKLQEEVRKLIGMPGITIGITPFFFINDRLVFSDIHNVNSVFLKNLVTQEVQVPALVVQHIHVRSYCRNTGFCNSVYFF